VVGIPAKSVDLATMKVDAPCVRHGFMMVDTGIARPAISFPRCGKGLFRVLSKWAIFLSEGSFQVAYLT
jgi:hypothetical protein